MIRIIENSSNISPSAGNRIVLNPSDYPLAYCDILETIALKKDVTIYTTNYAILQWFKNMSSRYLQDTFFFETLDARSALAQRWNIEIPANVTNDDILQAGLLSIDLQPNPGFSFEDTVLAHYYAPILTSKTFPFTQVPLLLDAINTERWKANRTISLLARTLHARLESWKNKVHSSQQLQLIELFGTDPVGLKQQLMRFRVLLSYPTIGDALMGDTFRLFSSLKLPLEDLKIEQSKIPEAVLQVTYYLNNRKPRSADEMAALLEGVSGLLSVEFDTIEEHLIHHPEWITHEILDCVESKFNNGSQRLARRICALRRLIRPPKPGFPDFAWSIDKMLSWATDSYLPYQTWCNAQEQFDPELYEIGDRFSEWLMKGWDDIHANSQRMVFNVLPNIAADLKRAGIVNLILVIDNLGWEFSEALRDLFQARGYFLVSAAPYLAMVPSETEISKKCLLAGAVGYEAIDDKTYKGMIEKGWVPYFSDNSFRYMSDIGSLGTIEVIDASTYVVNYLAVDKALHQSADELGMSHLDHIRHLLEKLVENAAAFVEHHSLQDSIRIHIVSDHGSTRIPTAVQNDLDPVFFKSNGFDARSHRYVVANNERFTALADNLRLDCFFLPSNDFLNPENVLCARRGNRFLPTEKDSYVHGGLLPEEIVVPYMLFEHTSVRLQDLTVLLKKNEYRYRMETVELEIGNPNDAAVEQIRVNILNANVDSEPVRVALLNGKTNTNLQIKARFKLTSIPEEQTGLRFRVQFRARGEQHTFDVLSKITMRKLVEEKSTGLFDD